jgi:hypothetical protein
MIASVAKVLLLTVMLEMEFGCFFVMMHVDDVHVDMSMVAAFVPASWCLAASL